MVPCIAGRPNTKAKVEAPMKLLDEIRAYNGKLDYSQLHQLVIKLNNRINSKCHTTTGKIPILYLEKKRFLISTSNGKDKKPLFYQNYICNCKPSSMINYKSNQYSVPPKYIGKKLKLQIYDNQIHVYYNTDLVTIHTQKTQKLNYHPEHYVAISSLTLKKPTYEIEEIAKNNLRMIGELYGNN